ncbi:MAG: peptidyl-prolyl cis-trans isomerase D [Halioglobus sp.]|jgi:peptidyl-prolyl cis-trans isomerase D
MLQDIRQNVKGTAAKVIVGIIVLSFSLFGIESILLGGGSNAIAEVNGEEVTPQELQRSLDSQRRRLISMMGENLDPAMLDDDRMTSQVLNSLINRKLLMQSAQSLELAISEREVGTVIGNMEQFQVDGVFSAEAYKSAVSGAGYTPSYFKQSIRDDLLTNQVRNGLAGSDFATPSELALNARIVSEQRDMRYLTIPREGFAVDADLSEEQIAEFYQVNEVMFLTEESVDLDFIELKPDDFVQPVDEKALLDAYELAQDDFLYKTQNRVSHILFEDVGEESIALRVAKAQEKLAVGAEFAEVAEEFSDDVGTASRGGDLGYSSGEAFPPEMEEALAQLELGEVSSPVESGAGTHLMIVTERNKPEMPSLEDMRSDLEESLQTAEARVALLRAVESLKDLSFNADDLSMPAEELALTVQQIEAVTRSQLEGQFAHPALQAAAFADDVLGEGHNSEVIELAGDTFIVLRVRRHNEPEVKALEDVRGNIVAVINEENAQQALKEEADRALQALSSGGSIEEFALSEGYEWQVELGIDRRNRTLQQEVLARVFGLPEPLEKGVSADVVMTQNGDAVIVQLVRVTAGDYARLDEAQQQQIEQLISGEFGGLIDNEFQRGLRQNAEINIL